MDSIKVQRNAKIAGSYDVVVCGGGPAGFIAALAAARQGAKTAIIEQYGFFGGMATNSFVTPISVFVYKDELVIGGIPWDFVNQLQDMGGAKIEKPLGNVAFEPELYKLLCQRLIKVAGIDMYMHSYLTDCVMENNYITHVIIENKNGAEALQSKLFIDCTGDADLSNLAGVPMQKSEGKPLQPMSSYFILGNVNLDTPMMQEAICHNKTGKNCYCLPVREKLLSLKDKLDIPEFGGPWFCTTLQKGICTVNMTRTAADALNNRDFCAAECRLREDAFKMAKILKDNFEEFKDSYIINIALHGGIRESRRIVGEHTISTDEYLNAYKYEDSVSRGAHPIDIHVANGASQNIQFLEKSAYVPYRSLYAKDFPNILVAGRCISADKNAFASLRVQASCMGTGQAAGLAAALSAKKNCNVQNIDVENLRNILIDYGANI